MNESQKKKYLEEYILTRFISNESHNLRIINIQASETPDFILEEINGRISVELTQLINPLKKQKEEFQNLLVERTRLLFREKHKDRFSSKLYVLICFTDKLIKASKNEIDDYANDLLSLIESIYLPNKNFEFRISTRPIHQLNDYISQISINNIIDFENWQPFGAYKVNDVNVDWVKSKIIDKENKISKYKETFLENWLLLVANYGHKSSTHGFYYLEEEKFQSKFDKIFLYKFIENAFVRLK